MLRRQIVPLLVLVIATTAASARGFAQAGTVEYHLVHKFHKFVGISKAMVVRGTVDASGLKVMARTQVGTFDSDNANRDEHMMETVEGEKYPWVSVRAAAPGFKLPTSGTTTVTEMVRVTGK